MRSAKLISVSALIILTVIAASAAEDQALQNQGLQKLANRIPPGTITNGQTMVLNGFQLEASHIRELGTDFKPDGREFESLYVSAAGQLKVHVTRDSPPASGGGVYVEYRDSGKMLLSLVDTDGDGRPDVLSYYSVDKAGNPTALVIDYDMDGQADYKVDFVKPRVELWHAGRWYTIEKRGGRRGIVLDGNFVELQEKNNGSFIRYFVP